MTANDTRPLDLIDIARELGEHDDSPLGPLSVSLCAVEPLPRYGLPPRPLRRAPIPRQSTLCWRSVLCAWVLAAAAGVAVGIVWGLLTAL